MAGKSFIFRFADVEVREREFSLMKTGERLAVEPKAFRVLLILLRNPGKLIPKQELLDAVWGDAAVTENSLARAIALLRRLLGDDARESRFIETVATVGYRWLCPAERVEDDVPVSIVPEPIADWEPAEVKTSETAAATAGIPPRISGKIRWSRMGTASAAVAAILLAVGIWFLSRPMPPPRITAYTQITRDGRHKILSGTDGSRVYFNQFSPISIAQVTVNGGEIARLSIAIPQADIFLRDISPDGTNALVGSYLDDGQWIAPILGGAAKRLESGEGGAFSPDGDSVIYSNLGGDIFMVRVDGSDKHKMASAGSISGGFSWSPDGKSIRFDKDGQLWEMTSDGSGMHRLLPDWKEPGSQCCGQWTPGGRFYLFRVYTRSGGGPIWGIDEGGQIWALDERRDPFRSRPSSPIRLTSGPIQWDSPVPSRDGTKIFAAGYTRRGELSRIDLKTGSLQPFLEGISAEYVSFSPDGKYLGYVAFPEGTLWKANRDGSNRMQLTQPPGYIVNPRWSPDSTEIAFTSESPDGRSSIRSISAADGTTLWSVPKQSADTADPNWSPDGTKVLYNTAKEQVINAPSVDLRIFDLKSRQIMVIPDSAGKWSPRWSPDGRFIVALLSPQVNRLPVFDVKLQQWFDLPVNGEVEFPNFSHDGKFIYFLREVQDQGVFRIPVTGGREERVVDLNGWHLTGFFGTSMSLDPTDAPLVLRDAGTDDIYALTLEP